MRILVGTAEGLHDLTDGTLMRIGAVGALARGEGRWWAITDGSVVRSSPDARSWDDGTRLRGLRANCLLPHGDGALAGTSEAHLVRVAGGRSARVREFDRVPTRGDWYTPWGGPPDVRSLALDAGGAVYANVHVGGILRSPDGERWTSTSLDVDADVHQVLADPARPGTAYAAAAIGLASTRDGGETWAVEDEGLHAAYCRAVAIAGEVLLLSASAGHTGRRAGLYRRPLDGGPFERCSSGLPEWFADNLDTHCLDARGADAALGTADGRVFASRDAGATWAEVASGLPPVACLALA